MPISINTNTAALNAVGNLQLTSQAFVQAVQRLSSGLRINSAADDPGGLGVSQKLIAQINGLDQAVRNTQDAVSLLQTAQTGLGETMADLQRLNELAIQASNGTLTSSDRQKIQLEAQGLIQDIDRVAQQTDYNTKVLLNGSLAAQVKGGGPNITNVQAQAGITPAGTYSLTAVAVQATKSAIEGAVPSASTFTGGGSITITGPTGVSQTFTSFAGEAVSTFIDQVNNAGLGVTASVESSGKVLLASNDFGLGGAGGDSNGNVNLTGPSVITATGNAGDVDFGNGAGAKLTLIGGTSGTVDASGNFSNAGARAAPVNAKITFGGTAAVLQGTNGDTFNGSGATAGITFRVVNPGSITANVDSITVTQNAALTFQIGANSGELLQVPIDAQTSLALGVNALDLSSQSGAETAITTIQNAITQLSAAQANLGALQNVLTSNQNLASAQQLNMQTANSNLVDANIPQESVNFTRAQILLQAGTAVLAQANQTPAGLLNLFNPSGPVL